MNFYIFCVEQTHISPNALAILLIVFTFNLPYDFISKQWMQILRYEFVVSPEIVLCFVLVSIHKDNGFQFVHLAWYIFF